MRFTGNCSRYCAKKGRPITGLRPLKRTGKRFVSPLPGPAGANPVGFREGIPSLERCPFWKKDPPFQETPGGHLPSEKPAERRRNGLPEAFINHTCNVDQAETFIARTRNETAGCGSLKIKQEIETAGGVTVKGKSAVSFWQDPIFRERRINNRARNFVCRPRLPN